MKLFNPNDLITMDVEDGKYTIEQAVYGYGDKFELSVITDKHTEYCYCLFFCGEPGFLENWPTESLSAEDVDSLMVFLVSLTGHQPEQI